MGRKEMKKFKNQSRRKHNGRKKGRKRETEKQRKANNRVEKN